MYLHCKVNGKNMVKIATEMLFQKAESPSTHTMAKTWKPNLYKLKNVTFQKRLTELTFRQTTNTSSATASEMVLK
jgi:hypothetical protein